MPPPYSPRKNILLMTARVTLRPLMKTDAPALIAANRASRTLHAPWVTPFTDEASFRSYAEGLDGLRKVGLVAERRDTGAIIGVLTLSEIVRGGFQNAYLGYYGLIGQTGQGLMTEALRRTLGYAFIRLGLHRIEANIQPGNHRSIALAQRVGFRLEGFSPRYLQINGAWQDHERWAVLSDWPLEEPPSGRSAPLPSECLQGDDPVEPPGGRIVKK